MSTATDLPSSPAKGPSIDAGHADIEAFDDAERVLLLPDIFVLAGSFAYLSLRASWVLLRRMTCSFGLGVLSALASLCRAARVLGGVFVWVPWCFVEDEQGHYKHAPSWCDDELVDMIKFCCWLLGLTVFFPVAAFLRPATAPEYVLQMTFWFCALWLAGLPMLQLLIYAFGVGNSDTKSLRAHWDSAVEEVLRSKK